MAAYKRLARGYSLEYTETGIHGKEQYQYDEVLGSGATIPSIGTTPMVDESGSNIASCIARRKTVAYPDGSVSHPVVTVDFETVTGGGAGQNIRDTTQRSVEVGTELVVRGSSSWYWKNETGVQITEAIHSVIAIMNVTVPVRKQGGSTVNTWIGTALGLIGKVNSSVFSIDVLNQCAKGSVLLTGISGGTQVNELGVPYWAFNLHFAARVLPGVATASDAKDGTWNMIWNQNTQLWDIPQDSGSGSGDKRMYENGDIASLIS